MDRDAIDMDTDPEALINPWITVSKTKRNRTFLQNDPSSIDAFPKAEVLNLQTNTFHNLSLHDAVVENAALNAAGIQSPHTPEILHPPPSPGTPSPPRKKSKKDPNKKSKYPIIKVKEDSINRQVSLTDFRDLVLWILDDTTSPDWIEVRSKSNVQACVAVLVPGLSPKTFNVDPTRGSEGRKMRRLKELEINPPLPNISEIFKYMWLPKAPGTNQQLYSPVSAFLNCPLTMSQSSQRAREQSKRNGNSIELETLLLNPNEMRTAGYPVHPLHDYGFADPGFVQTPSKEERPGQQKIVIGMDCEMCRTEEGMEVTRVTLVDYQGKTLFDKLVKPSNPILDYLTTWSGITEERLLNTTTTLAMIQESLLEIIDTNTILVGHSLECDLQALKMAHPHVIDTSVIYQHSRGPPYKPSLKWLAQKWLKRKIQEGAAGHDSAEDAKTCIDLVKLKVQKGKDFGLFNVDTESLFARLKRRGIDSAVIEYGNRGGSFYGDKVRTCMSAQSDAEVVDGILEALQTNHGFVWSRMKEVETAAHWKDNDSEEASQEEMEPALFQLDANLKRLWEALPPCTALMVITGSGDPREMSRLFAKKRTYEAELKMKKWDNIEVKWMDADLQAYTLAVDKARTGLGFVAIK